MIFKEKHTKKEQSTAAQWQLQLPLLGTTTRKIKRSQSNREVISKDRVGSLPPGQTRSGLGMNPAKQNIQNQGQGPTVHICVDEVTNKYVGEPVEW